MTVVKEIRHIFSLDDIWHVRIVCSQCNGEIARSLAQSSNMLPEKCPNCFAEWWDRHSKPRVVEATIEALKAIHRLMQILEVETTPISIRFEIDGDAEAKTG